jgi:hypothetical protein
MRNVILKCYRNPYFLQKAVFGEQKNAFLRTTNRITKHLKVDIIFVSNLILYIHFRGAHYKAFLYHIKT